MEDEAVVGGFGAGRRFGERLVDGISRWRGDVCCGSKEGGEAIAEEQQRRG